MNTLIDTLAWIGCVGMYLFVDEWVPGLVALTQGYDMGVCR